MEAHPYKCSILRHVSRSSIYRGCWLGMSLCPGGPSSWLFMRRLTPHSPSSSSYGAFHKSQPGTYRIRCITKHTYASSNTVVQCFERLVRSETFSLNCLCNLLLY